MDASDQFTGISFPRNNHRISAAVSFGRLLIVQPQPCFSSRRIRPVTMKALVRQNRTNITIEHNRPCLRPICWLSRICWLYLLIFLSQPGRDKQQQCRSRSQRLTEGVNAHGGFRRGRSHRKACSSLLKLQCEQPTAPRQTPRHFHTPCNPPPVGQAMPDDTRQSPARQPAAGR